MAQLTDYGQSAADQAVSTGQNALNSFDPNATADKFRNNWTSLFNTQQGQSNDYINSYKNQIASFPSLQQQYQDYGAQYNLPQLMQQSSYLNNQVANQPMIQQNTARGFDYSQGQVDNATNQALYRLQPLANQANSATQNAQQLVNGAMNLTQQQEQMELQPTVAQGQMLTDYFARQMTGYTEANEAELQGLINKMNAGVQLSATEMQRANALASAQAQYESAKMAADAQVQSARINATASENVAKIGNQNVTLNPYQTYLNTITGSAYRA